LNALDAVVTAYQSIAQLRQHIKQSERLHGIITEGGLAANIVPERAACRFYVRALDIHELGELKKRVHGCFEGAAMSTGTRAEIKWGNTDYLDMKTNWPVADAFMKNAEALGREFFPVKEIPAGFAGSTDMGNISHRVPSIHPMLAVAPAGVIIHNAEFAKWAASDKGDHAVIDGAKALAFTALDVMSDRGLLDTMKNDFEATRDISKAALAKLMENHPSDHHHGHEHTHGGCGCM
jgi:metal-dependent amidase/aminoacylase/carboxypeptidase family protein